MNGTGLPRPVLMVCHGARRGVPVWLAAALLLVLCAPLAAAGTWAAGAAPVASAAGVVAVVRVPRSVQARAPQAAAQPQRTAAPMLPPRSQRRATGARPSPRAP
jgi:hypothetical protein